MKKIVALSLALVLVIGITGAATFANFADDAASAGNQWDAGTLDLKTNDADGFIRTLYATAMAPGDTVVSSALTLKNTGTVNGATLKIAFAYTESDGDSTGVDKTPDEVAAVMEVVALDYDGSSLLGSIVNVYDLEHTGLPVQIGIDAGATKIFNISVQLKSDTGSDFEADGITITMTFTLNQ